MIDDDNDDDDDIVVGGGYDDKWLVRIHPGKKKPEDSGSPFVHEKLKHYVLSYIPPRTVYREDDTL